MRTSIIVAAHNEGVLLERTLQSIFETCIGLEAEILVVDDGSTDGSVAAVARRFPQVRLLSLPLRQGPGASKDFGADEAAGDVLVFLDAHTKPEFGAIQRLVEQVAKTDEHAVIVPRILQLDPERWQNARNQHAYGYALDLATFDAHWKPLGELKPAGRALGGLYECPALIGCAFAVSRRLYEKLLGQDVQMRGWGIEDIDLGLKAWLAGHPILLDPSAAIGHRFRSEFDNYRIAVPQLVANQLRMARKNFTESMWGAWVQLARARYPQGTPEYPEGVWARAWLLFEADRASVEQERAYLLGRRVHDEFWYADYFSLGWPNLRNGHLLPPPEESILLPGQQHPRLPQEIPQFKQALGLPVHEPAPQPAPVLQAPGPLEQKPAEPPQAASPLAVPVEVARPVQTAVRRNSVSGADPSPPPPPDRKQGPCTCDGVSGQPVRYFNGEVQITQTDVASTGFGTPWSHTRTYSNQMKTSVDQGNGWNWICSDWPYFAASDLSSASITLYRNLYNLRYFGQDPVTGDYYPQFGDLSTLVHDDTAHTLTLTEADGTVLVFYDLDSSTRPGGFLNMTDPGGNTLSVTQESTTRILEVQRSVTASGETVTDSFQYVYFDSSSEQADRLEYCALRRRIDSGSWFNIVRCVYSYYGSDDDNGGLGDLRTATSQVWDEDAGDWADVSTQYYRYYLGGTYLAHNLKFYVGPEAFVKLSAAVGDPFTASDSVVGMFADNYYEYDTNDSVSLERTYAGGLTITYDYERNPNYPPGSADPGPNVWVFKTTEHLPDGSERIVYANMPGQTMLYVVSDGDTSQWCTFRKYDEDGRQILVANPSAVTGYDDQYDDLLNYDAETGTYEYLRDHEGLINLTDFYDGSESTEDNAAPAGYPKDERIQKGQLGTPIPIRSWEYSSHTAGEITVYPVSKESVYPDESSPTTTIDTEYEYTYYSSSVQVQQKTTILPAVTTSQNGSGTSNTVKIYYDIFGYQTWLMNERGFISNFTYDVATGALIQQIDDVDTSITSGAPSGWTTPSGGGLNLITDNEADDQGRITQSLGPWHQVDLGGTATMVRTATWTVYDDPDHTVRTAGGFATGSAPDYDDTLVNPVVIRIMDHDNRPLDDVQAVRASTAGKLLPSDTFDQSSYVRWTTYQYTECCLLASQRLYHDIPSSGEGSSGTNYDQTDYGYDSMKRRNRMVTPGGTITFSVFDVRDFPQEIYVGTNDAEATDGDPTSGGEDPANNMVLVTANVYDNGTDGGDGNLTQQTQWVDDAVSRVTDFTYDWRDRLVTTDGEVDFFEKRYYTNLDQTVRIDRYDTSESGHLIARSDTKYDNLGRVYQTITYGVDPSTGTVGNALTSNTWYDPAGNVAKTLPAGSQLFTKTTYDSLNRPMMQYSGYGTDSSYASIFSVAGNVILAQTETTYDDASNAIQTVQKQRYHNAPASQTGALGNPSTNPKARVTYGVAYPDPIGRSQASADYGTNGGATFIRPETIPASSDTVLVSLQTYTDAGDLFETTDPAGMVTRLVYDDAGRRTQVIENYQEGSSGSEISSGDDCDPSADTNVTTITTYNPDGQVATLTAVNSSTGDQVTTYVYGTTLDDSAIASSLLLRSAIYPDSVDGSDQVFYAYNRQAQRTSLTDQNGNIHAYDYDLLGRPTEDKVATLGTGVDGAVRRLATTYEVRGMVRALSSYDNPAVGSGTVLNQVQFNYNDFAQSIQTFQAQGGAVNPSSTPSVQYGYASGSANTIRPTSLTYPNGRVLTLDYGSSMTIDNAASRIAAIEDGSDTLASYSYLGLNSVVQIDSPDADLEYTLVSLDGSNDPATGDIYAGLDRFGRIKDLRWRNTSTDTDLSRVQYGYDRASNRIWRQNPTDPGQHYDWLYGYDGLQRLKNGQRGTLDALHTGITNPQFAQCWTLDETGNWKGFRQDDTGSGTWSLVQTRAANAVNEIKTITDTTGKAWADPKYDRNGNMTLIPRPDSPYPNWATLTANQWGALTADQWGTMQSAGAFDAVYDAWNRLVKVSDPSGTVQENQYDARNYRIVSKTYADGVLSETRHVFYTDNWQDLEERLGTSSTPDKQFVWGVRYIDDLILRDRSVSGTLDERLYACQDANWNVTAIVEDSGDVAERFEYDPYGNTTVLSADYTVRAGSDYGWETTYAGYRWEIAIQAYAVRNRWYPPRLAVWLARDPSGASPIWFLYLYVSARPIIMTDPMGLEDVFQGLSGGRASDEYMTPWGPATACVPRYRNGKVVGSMGTLPTSGKLPWLPGFDVAVQGHYDRNRFNHPPATRAEAEIAGWLEQGAGRSIYHQHGLVTPTNIKYQSPGGHQEAIYDASGNLVTDPANMGTYNYGASGQSFGGEVHHVISDVLPYYIFGNSPDDLTPFLDRVGGPGTDPGTVLKDIGRSAERSTQLEIEARCRGMDRFIDQPASQGGAPLRAGDWRMPGFGSSSGGMGLPALGGGFGGGYGFGGMGGYGFGGMGGQGFPKAPKQPPKKPQKPPKKPKKPTDPPDPASSCNKPGS